MLGRIDDAVVLMRSGCLCCTVRGEIAESLLDLYSKRERGEIPWFDRVMIESTGLADPFPVLSTIRSHPVLQSHFTIGRVITTVDAVNAAAQIDRRDEAVRQIGAADAIVLTKTDVAEPQAVTAVRARMAAMNPVARVVESAAATVPELLADAAGRWLEVDPDGSREAANETGGDHDHHHHDHRAPPSS